MSEWRFRGVAGPGNHWGIRRLTERDPKKWLQKADQATVHTVRACHLIGYLDFAASHCDNSALIVMGEQIRLSPVPPKTAHEAGPVFS